MKPKTDKNPKGSGAPKKEETKPIFIRVPKVDHAELDKLCRTVVPLFTITVDGMKSWGFKDINFRTYTMIIIGTNLRKCTHAPNFLYRVLCPVFI